MTYPLPIDLIDDMEIINETGRQIGVTQVSPATAALILDSPRIKEPVADSVDAALRRHAIVVAMVAEFAPPVSADHLYRDVYIALRNSQSAAAARASLTTPANR